MDLICLQCPKYPSSIISPGQGVSSDLGSPIPKAVIGMCSSLSCSKTAFYFLSLPFPTIVLIYLRTDEIEKQQHDPVDYVVSSLYSARNLKKKAQPAATNATVMMLGSLVKEMDKQHLLSPQHLSSVDVVQRLICHGTKFRLGLYCTLTLTTFTHIYMQLTMVTSIISCLTSLRSI